jgi:single-stranded DNA-binding protein
MILCGNLGRDPELRWTSNGKAVWKPRLAARAGAKNATPEVVGGES